MVRDLCGAVAGGGCTPVPWHDSIRNLDSGRRNRICAVCARMGLVRDREFQSASFPALVIYCVDRWRRIGVPGRVSAVPGCAGLGRWLDGLLVAKAWRDDESRADWRAIGSEVKYP